MVRRQTRKSIGAAAVAVAAIAACAPPAAAQDATIAELMRRPASLLTLGLARIGHRMEHLSATQHAAFRVVYDAKTERIRILVEAWGREGGMKTSQENCAKLIGIVRHDAGFVDLDGGSPPTRYAGFFKNVGQKTPPVDRLIVVEATIDNSRDTSQVTIRDRISCSGDLASSVIRF